MRLEALSLFTSIIDVAAVARVLSPPSLAAKYADVMFSTTLMLYYGPFDRNLTLYGQTFVVGRDDGRGCQQSIESSIGAGMIAITYRSPDSLATFLEYKALDLQHAAAFVFVSNQPGFHSFGHYTWDRCEFCGPNHVPFIAMHSLARRSGDLIYFKDIFKSDDDMNITLQIGPPHDNSFSDLFLSRTWVVTLRIISPIMYILMSLWAFSELIRPKNRNSNVRLLICAIEVLVNALSGVWLALGHVGPNVMPGRVHAATLNQFSGLPNCQVTFSV